MSAAAKSATPTISLRRRETCDPDPLTASDLHDNGQHERAAARSLAEEPAQLHAEPLLDQALVGPLLDARLFHGIGQELYAVGEELVTVFHHETASDDLGHAFERPGLLVDGHDRHD